MTLPGYPAADNGPDRDPHPRWVFPFWMLFALAAAFMVGCGCGSFPFWIFLFHPPGLGIGD